MPCSYNLFICLNPVTLHGKTIKTNIEKIHRTLHRAITDEGLTLRTSLTFKLRHGYLCFVSIGLHLIQLHVKSNRKIL